MAVFYLW